AELDVVGLDAPPVRAAFIRGPVVEEVGIGATATAVLEDGRVVAVSQGNLIGLSFHPEITGETRFHEQLLAWADDRGSAARERVGMRLPIGSIDVSASGGTAEVIGRRGDEWNRVSDSEISVDEAISLLDAGAQDGAHVDPAR